jgi:hypothetical protein
MKSSVVGTPQEAPLGCHHVEGKQRSWRRLGYQAIEASSQGLGSPRSMRKHERRVGEIPGYVKWIMTVIWVLWRRQP